MKTEGQFQAVASAVSESAVSLHGRYAT